MSFLSSVKGNWTVSLGFAMIVLGGYMLWINRDYSDLFFVLSQTCMIGFGAVMLLNPVKTVMNNVALFALGLGLSRLINALPYVFSQYVELFLVGCGMAFVGGSMVYTGYMFINGKARAYRRMIYTASLVFFGMMYLVALMNYGNVESIITLWKDRNVLVIESFLMCMLYGILAFVLMDDRIISHGYYETVENDMVSTTDVTNLTDDLSIRHADALVLTDRNDPCWHIIENKGPVTRRYDFDVRTGKGSLLCIAQIWENDDRVHFTITANRTGTMIQAVRFSADRLTLGPSGLRAVGKDGFLASFSTYEEAEA